MRKNLIQLLILLFVALGFDSTNFAQTFDPNGSGATDIHPKDVIIWNPVQALSDGKGKLLVGIRLETRDQFAIYKNKLELRGPSGYSLRIANAPESRRQQDPMGEGETDVYDGGDFEIELIGDKPINEGTVSLFVTSLGCTHKICLFPFTQELKVPIYLIDESSLAKEIQTTESTPAPEAASSSDQAKLEDLTTPLSSLSLEEQYAAKLKSGTLSFGILLLVVFIGGLATNLTPCVFPMIPITLRLLAREGHKPIEGTLLYASGIIGSYTILGFVASLSGGIFGSILANPWVNAAFGVLFIMLAITMLGFGNLSRLQNLGATLGSGKASTWNSIAMGAGAGLVAAPCTGPIMAALIAYSAQLDSRGQAILLFFLYSLGFAIPYVFLGMAAKRVKSFKVSPRIQVGVKMIFAAAMFGLAAYYLKNTAYESLLVVKGHWQTLATILLTLGAVGMALILSRGTLLHRKGTQLLPAIFFGLGLFALVQVATGTDLVSELKWIKSEQEAYDIATKENKPILVDGWADWCVACKDMDKSTFRDERVISLLKDKWVFVKLDLTESNEANESLAAKYEMSGLPTLVLVPQDGDLKKAKRLTGYLSADRLLEELANFQGQ